MKDVKKLILLLVGPLAPPPGGIATAVSNFLNSDLTKDFKIIHINNSTCRPVSKKGAIDLLNIVAFILQSTSMLAKLVVCRPHIVQIETSSGISFLKNSFFILISKIAFRKTILSIHGSGPRFIEFFRALPSIGKLYLRFVLSRCNAIRVESEKWISAFASEFDLEESKIHAIPNAVRIEEFNENISPKKCSSDKVTLLFLGCVGAKKGVFDLLDSVETLVRKGYKFKLLVVGPEMRKGDINKARNAVASKHLDKYVEILGEQRRSDVLKYYHTANIYLLPSYTEGLPLGILEAMAAGLPIVSTKVGAIPEVIEEGVNGFLINPGDVMELASKIEALMNDKPLREKMEVNNKAKVREKYSLAKHIEMFNKLYLRLLGIK